MKLDYKINVQDDESSTREITCLDCGHKFGWHSVTPKRNDGRICYGLACTCQEFYRGSHH